MQWEAGGLRLDGRGMSWQERVVRSNARAGRLILTSSNSGYEPFLRNWLGGLRAIDVHEFVVVTLDRAILRVLTSLDVDSHAVNFGALPERVGASSSWYDIAYRRLMGSHPMILRTIFAYGGLDLIWSDIDVAWVRSPWPVMCAPARAHCQLQAMAADQDGTTSHRADPRTEPTVRVHLAHPQANCAQCLNAGMLFVRRGSASMDVLNRWAAMLQAQGAIDHNQKWLNWVLATGGVLPVDSAGAVANGSGWSNAPRVCLLGQGAFSNGWRLRSFRLPLWPRCTCAPDATGCEARRRRISSELVVAHLNFALSAAHKTCLAKGAGVWLLSDDPKHRSAYEGVTQSAVERARRWSLYAAASNESIDFTRSDGMVVLPGGRPALSDAKR